MANSDEELKRLELAEQNLFEAIRKKYPKYASNSDTELRLFIKKFKTASSLEQDTVLSSIKVVREFFH